MTRRFDSPLHRLVVGAVRHADAIELPEAEHGPDYHERFIATDEDLREAALAFARSLSPVDRKRLGAP